MFWTVTIFARQQSSSTLSTKDVSRRTMHYDPKAREILLRPLLTTLPSNSCYLTKVLNREMLPQICAFKISEADAAQKCTRDQILSWWCCWEWRRGLSLSHPLKSHLYFACMHGQFTVIRHSKTCLLYSPGMPKTLKPWSIRNNTTNIFIVSKELAPWHSNDNFKLLSTFQVFMASAWLSRCGIQWRCMWSWSLLSFDLGSMPFREDQAACDHIFLLCRSCDF